MEHRWTPKNQPVCGFTVNYRGTFARREASDLSAVLQLTIPPWIGIIGPIRREDVPQPGYCAMHEAGQRGRSVQADGVTVVARLLRVSFSLV